MFFMDVICVLAHLQKFGGDKKTGLFLVQDPNLHIYPMVTLLNYIILHFSHSLLLWVLDLLSVFETVIKNQW